MGVEEHCLPRYVEDPTVAAEHAGRSAQRHGDVRYGSNRGLTPKRLMESRHGMRCTPQFRPDGLRRSAFKLTAPASQPWLHGSGLLVGLGRVGGFVDGTQAVDRDVGVDLRRVQVLMTQQRLDTAQVRSVLQHQRRCRVAEDVACPSLVDPRRLNIRPHQKRYAHRMHRRPNIAQEQLVGRVTSPTPAGPLRELARR
jgi:hypothetical protein